MPNDLKHILALIRSNALEALRDLLRKIPADTRSITGRTPLHCAAEEGNPAAVRIILEAGCQVNARTSDGETPLHFAASYGNCGGLLLSDPEYNEGVTEGHRSGPVPMHPDVKAGFWRIFHKLYPGLPTANEFASATQELADASNEAQCELIYSREKLTQEYAALGINVDALDRDYGQFLRGYPGYMETASLLLDHGADINARNNFGDTPLHFAVERAELPMVELLVQRGANLMDPEEIDRLEPPLAYAIELGRLDMAKLLFAAGAKVHWNVLPLHHAAASAETKMVSWLLEVGGDINQVDARGNTPIMAAADGHHAVVTLLCERGADLQHRNLKGQTVLHLAAGWAECVRPLLGRGIPIDATDEDGRTPLHFAALGLGPASIGLLVEAGAAVNAQDKEGNTPLHVIFFGDELRPDIELPTFKALIAAGANRAIRNKDGKTPFDLAIQSQYPNEYLALLQP